VPVPPLCLPGFPSELWNHKLLHIQNPLARRLSLWPRLVHRSSPPGRVVHIEWLIPENLLSFLGSNAVTGDMPDVRVVPNEDELLRPRFSGYMQYTYKATMLAGAHKPRWGLQFRSPLTYLIALHGAPLPRAGR
jgi:hypothetical protein